ncbi:MAG: class I SAM-dependent methyltransferase [Methylococcales bacterium]|nr:MAG: class I SAM-dependent methyltransferase [Methylococcales bacterium]
MSAVVASLSKSPSRIDLLLRKAFLDKLAHLENAVLTISDALGECKLGAESSDGLSARIEVLDMSFYRQVGLGGSIGAAESYMDQQWQADDLCSVIQILVRNRDLLDSLEGGLATLANQLLKVWHFANRNSQQGSKKNIAAHYDLGNDLFALFLDQHGMYSSATFYQAEQSLEDASTAKLERICQKLDLQPEDHVVEIGTGWGGFATYAAKNYGCRITTTTISKEQFQAAQLRIAEAGVAEQVTVLMEDYRDLQGSYDKLVSIEMIEAVGHQYLDTYLKQCAALLKPNGLALIQAITIEDRYYQQALKSVDFIKRYIFPGSFIPCVNAIVGSASRSTDLRLINLEDQGESYAITLNHWRKRFMAELDQVRAQGYNEEFIRMWEFYLCYCEGGFLEKSISNVQLLLAKPANRRQQWLPNYES